MSAIIRKNKIRLKPEIVNIQWYPSSRSCVIRPSRRMKLQQMPPLMVRKAEWRR